ncbi:hypothetical protein Ocin01_01548 [Orchesella cincta]|uniref:Uncharacterized protein n=1 Tax=Orchesella cincta TaxID=48709 RepID=A0A1D2NIV4_ORCCI|nr:hypothetical protein Ocin01_01548 [Orchesella cincta]
MIRPLIFSVCIASFIVWLNLLCFIDLSEAEESIPMTVNATGEQIDCWGIVMRAAKSIIKKLRSCTKDVKANSTSMKEMSEKLGCVMKCVLHRVKFVNEDYMVSDETLSTFIHQYFPNEKMVNYLMKVIRKECLEGNATKLDPSEDNCSSYGKFAVCMQSDLGDILNNPEYCIPKAKDKEFSFG